MTDHAQTMTGSCIVCGDTNYNLSFGGPSICPKCDCGHFDAATVEKQAKIIAGLREEIADLRSQAIGTPDDAREVTKEELVALHEWMRHPDWTENFSLEDMKDWINSRPTNITARLIAIPRKQEAKPVMQIIPLPLWAATDLLKWMRRQKDHKTLYPSGLDNLLQALIAAPPSGSREQEVKQAAMLGPNESAELTSSGGKMLLSTPPSDSPGSAHQPQGEPVAWQVKFKDHDGWLLYYSDPRLLENEGVPEVVEPLYATPPAPVRAAAEPDGSSAHDNPLNSLVPCPITSTERKT